MLTRNVDLVWWVIALPVGGFLAQALFGEWLIRAFGARRGKWLCGALAVIPIFCAFGVTALLTLGLMANPAGRRSFVSVIGDWITLGTLRVPFELLVDPLSITMALIITGVGVLIHLYATGYMAEERDYPRFFTYMNLFVAFMLVLVLANNLPLLFIGWEGVGLCSYLLIGFWYEDLSNARAANKAFIVNRIGDWGLTLGIFWLFAVMYANRNALGIQDARFLSYDVILPNAVAVLKQNPWHATAIALLLFVGAAGKSAQLPLYFWLPDAMAGPTPVSALIHAATMVTAGVFLLNRMHVIFELSPVAGAVVAMVGAFTALFAAVVAFSQTDIKKVLAYSTVSQLGFMFVACGVGAFGAAMFHVTTHAFFKALLFLGAGAVIYAMAHDQDLRNYGRLTKYLPVTAVTMIVGWLAISGFPGLSGFFSKEAMIGGALAGRHAVVAGFNFGALAGWIALLVAALTAVYMTRMTLLTFGGRDERWREAHARGAPEHSTEPAQALTVEPLATDPYGFFFTDAEMDRREASELKQESHALEAAHTPRKAPVSMTLSLVVLAILSLGAGFFMSRGEAFQKWLYPEPLPVLGETTLRPSNVPLMALSIVAALLGLLVGFLLYRKGLPESEGWNATAWSRARRGALNQFGYDRLMTWLGARAGGQVAVGLRRADEGFIAWLVNGVGVVAGWLGGLLRKAQTGHVRAYALTMMLGVVGLLGWIFYFIWSLAP